ncbi:hypothetical protein C6P42_003809, partial [Pichia californica]
MFPSLRLCISIISLGLITPAVADFEGKLANSNVGCAISGVTMTNGFSANIYAYPFSDMSDYSNTAYFNGDYATSLLTTVANVADPNFVNNQGYASSTTSNLWGVDLPITNFAAQLTGYFYDGIYNFQMLNVDESAMVWMGTGGFDCCKPELSQLGTADTAVLFASKNSASTVQESYVYLEKDNYYPIRIVYINAVSDGKLQFDIIDPTGHTADISEFVYQLSGDLKGMLCTYSTATSSMGTITFFDDNIYPGTTIYSPITTSNSLDVTTVVIGETIGANILTNTIYKTITYTGTTISTDIITIGTTLDGNLVGQVVETIYVPPLSTSTSTWQNAWSTVSTAETVITEKGGSVVTSTYIVDEVPAFATTYIAWDSTGYSTHTTTNAKGSSEVIINGPTYATVTTTWHNAWSTVSTAETVITEKGGSVVTSTYIVDEVPAFATTYIAWDSTGYSTHTTTNAKGSSEVIINGPTYATVTSVGTATNGVTNTFTTYAVTTGADHSIVTSTYIEVVIPAYSTLFSVWDSTYETTYTSTWITSIGGVEQTTGEVIIRGLATATVYSQIASGYGSTVTLKDVVTTNLAGKATTEDVVVVYQSLTTNLNIDSTLTGTTTYTTTDSKGQTEIVVAVPSLDSFTTVQTNIATASTTYAYFTDANTGYWEYVVYVPSYSVTASQWNKEYTSTLTYATTMATTTSLYIIEYVPSYAVSYSYWSKNYIITSTYAKTLTDHLSVYTTTVISVYAPSIDITTTTWEKPYTTTVTSYQTFSSNGEHFTSSEIIVEIPDATPVESWSTVYVTSTDCDASGTLTSYYTTTIAGAKTTIGYEYVNTPISTCYLPPAATKSTTVTTEATDCTLVTGSSTTSITGTDSFITTVVSIIVSTPAATCAPTTSTTVTTSATDCTLATGSSTTSTTGKDKTVTTVVSIVVSTPAATCAPTTSTTVTTSATDCTLATGSSTTSTTGKDKTVTTVVSIVVSTPAAT